MGGLVFEDTKEPVTPGLPQSWQEGLTTGGRYGGLQLMESRRWVAWTPTTAAIGRDHGGGGGETQLPLKRWGRAANAAVQVGGMVWQPRQRCGSTVLTAI